MLRKEEREKCFDTPESEATSPRPQFGTSTIESHCEYSWKLLRKMARNEEALLFGPRTVKTY